LALALERCDVLPALARRTRHAVRPEPRLKIDSSGFLIRKHLEELKGADSRSTHKSSRSGRPATIAPCGDTNHREEPQRAIILSGKANDLTDRLYGVLQFRSPRFCLPRRLRRLRIVHLVSEPTKALDRFAAWFQYFGYASHGLFRRYSFTSIGFQAAVNRRVPFRVNGTDCVSWPVQAVNDLGIRALVMLLRGLERKGAQPRRSEGVSDLLEKVGFLGAGISRIAPCLPTVAKSGFPCPAICVCKFNKGFDLGVVWLARFYGKREALYNRALRVCYQVSDRFLLRETIDADVADEVRFLLSAVSAAIEYPYAHFVSPWFGSCPSGSPLIRSVCIDRDKNIRAFGDGVKYIMRIPQTIFQGATWSQVYIVPIKLGVLRLLLLSLRSSCSEYTQRIHTCQ